MIVVDVQQPLWMLSGMVMPSRITKQPLGYCKIFPKPSFVCVFLVPLKNFSLIWRCHCIQCRAANFDLLVYGHWWPFSMPHLLWHGTSIYNGHLGGHMTHTQCQAFPKGTLTTCFNDIGLSRLGFEHPTFCMRGRCSDPLRHLCG